ncbi:MAG TPA: phage holin family protein [Thermoleophilaceae bacterium]|nr:phage holin family protein [Thermoleophilaceae bacterium]
MKSFQRFITEVSMAVQTANDRSVSDLVQQLSAQTGELVRQELRLAQVEMQEKGKRVGAGAGLFGGAGLVALYGVGFLLAAAAMLLATALEPWIAVAIVGGALLLLAGLLALTGKKQVDQALPLAPEQAIETTKQDVDHVKARASR